MIRALGAALVAFGALWAGWRAVEELRGRVRAAEAVIDGLELLERELWERGTALPELLPPSGPAASSEPAAPAAWSALAPSAEPIMLSKSAAGAALPPATEAALRPAETDSPSPGVIGAVSSEVISHGSRSRRALSSACRTDCSCGSA